MEYAECWNFFAKIYCISVDHRQDRRRTARQEFAKVGLLERVEFVIVKKHPRNPEQGIYESHLLCMEKGLAAGAETILIFEDDILFHGFRETALKRACSQLNSYPNWDGLFLGCIVSRIERTGCDPLVRIGYRCLTHAYAVHRDFAEHLIRIPWQGIPYDGLLKQENGKLGSHRIFFGLWPMVAFQSASETDNKTMKIDKMRRFLGGLQRIQRLNGLFHYHKKAIIISHAAVVLAFFVVWSYFHKS